jgi:hypothetical protein
MANAWVSLQQLQDNITLIEDLLQQNGLDYADRPFYEQMLNEQYEELRDAQASQNSPANRMPNSQMNLSPAYHAQPTSPASSSGTSRKRSIGANADCSNSKRVSVNPSPITPNTPNSVYSEPTGYRPASAGLGRQQALPSRPAPTEVIDLTLSNPPTPDPFPELNNAYMPGVQQPIDPWRQDCMPLDELTRLLMTPNPAGANNLYQQPLQAVRPVAGPAYAGYEPAEVPLYVGNAYAPWAPSDNEDEYGVPLTVDEVQAVENLLDNVQANDAEDAPERREQTPRIMCSQLKEYQKIGLTWLIKMETGTNKGGILADGMGLGKTVQAISLICARPSEDPLRKTTLIIAPVALMRQWEKEIERHVHPRYRLKVYVYHGSGKNVDFAKLRTYDVVLTTFGTLTSEFKQKETRKESTLHEAEQRDPTFRRKASQKLALLGHECMWYRVIIDEAQCIKNRQTIGSKAAHALMAVHRLVMTGTPMMNSIDELYPLIRFLRIAPYSMSLLKRSS